MTSFEIMRTRAALRAMAELDGAPAGAIAEYVATATGRPLSDADGAVLLSRIHTQGYAATYTQPLTDQVCYVLTEMGKVALASITGAA